MPPAEVVPGLYLGDKKDAKDRGALRRLNIQAVVNCTPPKNVDPAAGCPSFFERELRYHRVPIYDSPAEDAAQHFAAVLDFIAGRLHHGGVLVHCNRGVSRSATFVVAHLMKSRELDPAAALALVRATRPSALPNAAFLKQLDAFHAELEAARERDAARLGRGPRGAAPTCPVAAAPEPPARAAGPAPRPAAAAARPERAGPARPLVTAPARPERAGPARQPLATAPVRPDRAGPAPRPLATAPARPERAGPAPRPLATVPVCPDLATAPACPERAIGAPPWPEKRPAPGEEEPRLPKKIK